MIRVGIVGCGGMGNHHAPHLAGLPGMEVVATCDLVAEKAQELASRIGVERSCTDFRELLADVDAVWVCTEPFNRVDIVTAAAAAGVHIFTEKPIARSLEDAQTMISAARKAGVVYMLGYCLRFWQPYRLVHDTFASGELGTLTSCWMRRTMPWSPARWYAEQERSGGVMLDFGSHDVDWLRWIGGEVQTVFGATKRVRQDARADDHGAAIFVFAGGGAATVENSWSSALSESTLGVIGSQGAIVMGSNGEVRKRVAGSDADEVIDVQAVTAVDPAGNVGARDAEGRIRTVEYRNESMYEHFIRCIRDGVTPLTSAEDGRETLRTIMALWESAATGRAVDVARIG